MLDTLQEIAACGARRPRTGQVDHDVLAEFGQASIADQIACPLAADQKIIPGIALQRVITHPALDGVIAPPT